MLGVEIPPDVAEFSPRRRTAAVQTGDGPPAQAPLVEVEQGRLGVLSSNDAYLFHFKEMKLSSSSLLSGSGERLASVDEAEAEENVELHLVYVWIGREASVEACAAARAQVGPRAAYGLAG